MTAISSQQVTSVRIFFSLLIGLITPAAFAEDTLQSVMARMKPAQAVSIHYQETRALGLLSEPWKGTGTFYAFLPDIMLKEQQRPEKELMGIKGSTLYYYHPGNDQKHQGELDDEAAEDDQVAAFKGLMNGDLTFLRSRYTLEFSTKPTGWRLTLIPLHAADNDKNTQIIMQGLPGRVANKLELILSDGDRTEYTLTPAMQGEAVKVKVTQLLAVLEGH
jgi:outer membrane lipoprotein-sorting protein